MLHLLSIILLCYMCSFFGVCQNPPQRIPLGSLLSIHPLYVFILTLSQNFLTHKTEKKNKKMEESSVIIQD